MLLPTFFILGQADEVDYRIFEQKYPYVCNTEIGLFYDGYTF